MNIKAKVAGLMTVTLIAGIGIGAMLQRAFIQHRIKSIVRMDAAGRVFPRPENFLKPESEEQAKAIKEAFDKNRTQLAEIHKRFRKEIDASFDTLDKELDPILTPEQKRRLKDHHPKPLMFPGRGPAGGPGGPFMGGFPGPGMWMDDLKKELSLTGDQAVQIQGIIETFRNAGKPEFEGAPPQGGPESFRERMKEMDAAIEKVLSDQQKEIFRKFMEKRMRRPGGEPPPPNGGPEGGPGPDPGRPPF
jgi:hypothetical protein